MNYPILDFFEEKGFIGKDKYKVDEQHQILQSLNINSALFVFNKNVYELIDNKEKLNYFYTFKNMTAEFKWYIYWCATAKYNGYKFAQLVYFSDAVKEGKRKVFSKKEELQKYAIELMIDCVDGFVDTNN